MDISSKIKVLLLKKFSDNFFENSNGNEWSDDDNISELSIFHSPSPNKTNGTSNGMINEKSNGDLNTLGTISTKLNQFDLNIILKNGEEKSQDLKEIETALTAYGIKKGFILLLYWSVLNILGFVSNEINDIKPTFCTLNTEQIEQNENMVNR